MTTVASRLMPHCTELFDRGDTRQVREGLPPGLQAFYADFNGGYFWGRALLVRPYAWSGSAPLSVREWNEPNLWKAHYGSACAGLTFFAEDAFGVPYAVRGDEVVQFDPETAVTTECGTVGDWTSLILDDTAYYTGSPVLSAWEAEHGALPFGYRLIPKKMFVLGGEFHSANMVSRPEVEGMRIRAQFWQLTKDIPDGQQIVFKSGE